MTTFDTAALGQRTVGDLVTEDYRRAAVFKRFGIDFCCGGGATLRAVCDRKGLDVADVARALASADTRGPFPQLRVTAWAPGFLADYIVNEHHAYVRENIPVLRAFTQKVARVHGGGRPELVQIASLFDEVAAAMEAHMACEEQIVFPAVRAVADAHQAGSKRDVQTPLQAVIDEMEGEHDEVGEKMRQIRTLSNDFTPPPDACNTYRASFAKLEEFEDDLHRHVHLENNVLFPKALALDAARAAAQSGDGASASAATPAAPPTLSVSKSTDSVSAPKILDVRVIPPAQKHPAIFTTFDALAAGDHFVLVNDHDPVPLRYQFEFTRSGQVGWEYLEQGPELWRVKISKLGPAAA